MRRVAVLLLAAAGAALARDDYERDLEAAEETFWRQPPWATWETRLNAEYEALNEVGVKHHGKERQWYLHFRLGLNRCKRVFFARSEAEAYLARLKIAGATEEQLAATRAGAERMFGIWLDEASTNFQKMRMWMQRYRVSDPDRVLFAQAAARFAARRYEDRSGEPGAITCFRQLVARQHLPDTCANHIALCYLDLGHDAFLENEVEKAQRLWDEGLRWARAQPLRQLLYTNKAGGYEMDNQFDLAEKLVREQIVREPRRPLHHKNLGLVLGYQGRLKEALYHYRRARELCRASGAAEQLSLLHGNAWMRAASIHGVLLREDGDLRLAWRLFLAYRARFGDDYNFSLWFGEFAAAHGQYELAWRFFLRARNLQPRCLVAYQKLTEIAFRTGATREQGLERAEEAKRRLAAAKRLAPVERSPAVERLCSGLSDVGDLGMRAGFAGLLVPDPLAGFTPERPPPWVKEAAAGRRPFAAWEPAEEEAVAGGGGTVAAQGERGRWWPGALGGALGLVAVVVAGFLLLRRR